MTLRERLESDLKEAMRAHDQVRVDTIRNVKSEVKYKEVEGSVTAVLDDAGIERVVQSLVKKRQDAAAQFRAGNRPELAEKEEREAAILKGYLPAPLAAAELEPLVDAAIAETGAAGLQDLGKVMRSVQPKVGGRADGRTVSELVKKKLGG